jgi:Ni/Fe-hydrogenase subunit HybB-like protein
MTSISRWNSPLVLGNKTSTELIEDICNPIEHTSPKGWKILMLISLLFLGFGGYCLGRTFWDGIGMWGENKTIGWAWDITNFVWWIGIGHAGTLISAILLLFRQEWRNSINRSAEAMTIAAVICSSIFVLGHVGRIWLVYWIFPIPNKFGSLWVNFNSALVWDSIAIFTYLTVSIIYWYIGCLPDFAILRERSKGLKKKIYNALSFSFNGSVWTWRRYESFMRTTAGLATILVISVHSIVSMDFATGVIPGWHSTIFPPYFVVGAILSGLAMVVTLIIPIRKYYHLENYITITHIDFINQFIIACSIVIGFSYLTELFIGFYAGKFETYITVYRLTGDYNLLYFTMLSFNVILPQLLWIKPLRRNLLFSFIMALLINIGMWTERFVLIVSSISRDFLPSSWNVFAPTIYDIGTFIFSIGLFMFLFLLFAKYIPVINMSEVAGLINHEKNKAKKNQKGEKNKMSADQ